MCNTCGCSAAEEINPVESVVVPAPLGRGVAQFYSEGGDMATYAPSEEADMTSPATEPTNANFSAESKSMFGKDKNGRMYARRRNGRIITHNAETFNAEDDVEILYERWKDGELTDEETLSLIDILDDSYSDNDGERLSHMIRWIEDEDSEGMNNLRIGIKERFGAESLNAESKSMFGKDKNGRMYARRRNGRIITHNAEHEGLYACSKCKHWNRNPVDDITKCKKCGNETFTFVKRSEFMPEGDGNVVGQQTFGFNGTPLHAEEDTSFGLVGEGNDFGQMRAEYEADYALEKPFTTGAKISAGLLTGAALFGVVGASLTALLGSMMGRGE